MKINHYLCGIIASINKMKIDFFNQLPLGTKVEALFNGCGFTLENKGATSGSRVKFYNEKDQNSYIMHKPHPSNIIKGYMMRDILNYLLKNGYIK